MERDSGGSSGMKELPAVDESPAVVDVKEAVQPASLERSAAPAASAPAIQTEGAASGSSVGEQAAVQPFVRSQAWGAEKGFRSVQDYLQRVTMEQAKPLDSPLKVSTDVIIPLVNVAASTRGDTPVGKSSGDKLAKKPHALAEQLGCNMFSAKAMLVMTTEGTETEFSKLAAPCLRGNVSELQARLSAKLASASTVSLARDKAVVNGCDVEGRSLLCLAVHGACAKCCEHLLASGCDVDFPDTEGNTPLHYACLLGDHGIVKVLLRAGAESNKRNHKGSTPLHLAVASASDKAVHAFLKEVKGGALDVDVMNGQGFTPLALAVFADHASIVGALLKARADAMLHSRAAHGYCAVHYSLHNSSKKSLKCIVDMSRCLHARTAAGLSTLHLAAATGSVTNAEFLLKKGGKADARDKLGCTPFHWAAFCGQTAMLGFLLDWKKGLLHDPATIKDAGGAGLLAYAALQGHLSVARFLLSRGFCAEERDENGRLPSHYGALGPQAQNLLKELLNTNPDLVKAGDNEGNNVLHLAAMVGNLELVQWLVGNYSQLELNVQTRDRCSSLWLAASNGHAECTEWLAARGADIHLLDQKKQTPLHAASQNGHPGAVEALLTCGAEVGQADGQGCLPLHLAAGNGHLSVISFLLSKVSSVDVATCRDRTALSYSAECGHTVVCQLLVENGANVNKCDASADRQSPLDYALQGGHRECADYLVSVGGFTWGGRFHRAVSVLKAVWKFKTLCRQKKSTEQHAARVLQRAARGFLARRATERNNKIEAFRRNRAARIIQIAWRKTITERHRYEASYKKLKQMLQREKRQAYLSLDALQFGRPEPTVAKSPAPVSMTRNRRLTLAPQRVPTLDSREHTELVASMTNLASGMAAAGKGKGEVDGKARPVETVSSFSPGAAPKKSSLKKDKSGPDAHVTPKQLTISLRPGKQPGQRSERTSSKALPPVVGKRKGQESQHSRRLAPVRTRPDTLDVIEKLETSIMNRDAEIQRLREENQRLLAKEREEYIASTRLPTVALSAAARRRTVHTSPSAKLHTAAMAVLQNNKATDHSTDVAVVAGRKGTDSDHRRRCEELKVMLHSMEEPLNRSQSPARPVVLDALSPRSKRADTERMRDLERALDEAVRLQSDTQRLSEKVLRRVGQQN